jgi:hypothetical protein
MYPPKVSKSLNVGTLSIKPSLTDRKVVACVSRDHFCFLFFFFQNTPQIVIPAIPRQIPARFGRNLARIWRASFPLSLSLSLSFFGEHIWGPIREPHEAGVGGGRFTSAIWVQQFGSGGGRFTTLTLISVSLCLSLAHSQSSSHFLSHSLTVSLSHSPAVWVTQLNRFASRFDGGISKPHPRALLVGVLYLRHKLPLRPAPDDQIRSGKKKKACKNLSDSNQISSESGGVSPKSPLIRVIQWDGGILGSKKATVVT